MERQAGEQDIQFVAPRFFANLCGLADISAVSQP